MRPAERWATVWLLLALSGAAVGFLLFLVLRPEAVLAWLLAGVAWFRFNYWDKRIPADYLTEEET